MRLQISKNLIQCAPWTFQEAKASSDSSHQFEAIREELGSI